MLAVDHGYFQGPATGLERIDLNILPLLEYADVLMCTRGALRATVPPSITKPVALRCSGGNSILSELSNDTVAVDIEDAVRLAEKSNRRNIGVIFNLYHWLKTDKPANLQTILAKASPYLLVVTINPAGGVSEIYSFMVQRLGPRPEDHGAVIFRRDRPFFPFSESRFRIIKQHIAAGRNREINPAGMIDPKIPSGHMAALGNEGRLAEVRGPSGGDIVAVQIAARSIVTVNEPAFLIYSHGHD